MAFFRMDNVPPQAAGNGLAWREGGSGGALIALAAAALGLVVFALAALRRPA